MVNSIGSTVTQWLLVECLSRDRGVAGSNLIGVVGLCPLKARHINPCLVLVQPRKTRPGITEKLLFET